MNPSPRSPSAELLERTFGRRRFLAVGAGALGSALSRRIAGRRLCPTRLRGNAFDVHRPAFREPHHVYMQQRGLTDDYSQFAPAGAAAGVVAPAFASWHDTFWDNLAASIELHQVNAVIAIDHRDCGAFRVGVLQRHPDPSVETCLMALDGSMLRIGS